MTKLRRPAVALLVLGSLWPTLAFGQAPKAGIVTTLKGSATATRPAAAQPVNLKFKDDVFLQDRISTADQSLARLLLGGKAVVTIRERSQLTITEVPDRATLNLQSGKIALAVAREKMRPGEVIDIRTPNAVAAVRGTVVVADTEVGPAQSGAASPGVVTNIYVLSDPTGHGVLVTRLDPVTGAPIGAPVMLGALQGYNTATGKIVTLTPEQVAAITADLKSDPQYAGAANQDAIVALQMEGAVALVGALPELFSVETFPAAPFDPNPKPGVTAVSEATSGSQGCTAECQQSGGENIGASPRFTVPPDTFTGFSVGPGEVVELQGPLLVAKNSTLTLDNTKVVDVFGGTLTSTDPQGRPVISIDPSTLGAADFVVVRSLIGEGETLLGSLTVRSTLLQGTDTDITIKGGDFLSVGSGATLTNTSADTLVKLAATPEKSEGRIFDFGAGAFLRNLGGTVDIGGGLLSARTIFISGADFITQSGGSFTSRSGTLVSLTDNSDLHLNFDTFLKLSDGAEFTAAGSLLGITDSEAVIQSDAIIINGSTLSADSVLSANNSGVHISGNLVTMTSSESQRSSLEVDSLLKASNHSQITIDGSVLSARGSEVATNTAVRLSGGSSLTVGSLLDTTNTTTDISGAVASLEGASALHVGTDGVSAIKVDGGVLNTDFLFTGDTSKNTLTFGGSALDLTDATVNIAHRVASGLNQTAPIFAGGDIPVVRLTNSDLSLGNDGSRLLDLRVDTGQVDFFGVGAIVTGKKDKGLVLNSNRLLDIAGFHTRTAEPFVQALDGALISGAGDRPLVEAGGPVATEMDGLVGKIVGSEITGFANFFLVDGGRAPGVNVDVALNDSLVVSTPSAATETTSIVGTTSDFIHVSNGARLASTRSDPFVTSSQTSYAIGAPGVHSHFLLVSDLGGVGGKTGASASFVGPLLKSTNDVFNITADFVEANRGGTISRTAGTDPFLQFSGSTATGGHLAFVADGGTLSLTGPLASVDATEVPRWELSGLVFSQTSGATVTGLDTNGNTDPLVVFSGQPLGRPGEEVGVHQIAAAGGQAMFDLVGSPSHTIAETDPDTLDAGPSGTGLTVGTDRPLRHDGELLHTVDTRIGTNQFLRVDPALVEATRPLANLIVTTMRSSSDFINLVQQSKLTVGTDRLPADALVLNASSLTVSNGSLVNLAGGSFMRVNGNLVSLLNGSKLDILAGALVSVSGGSVFKLTGGSLGLFGDGTKPNTINITNLAALNGATLETPIPNLPILLRNGATLNNVVINLGFTPFANLGSTNTVNFSGPSAAALVVDGSKSKVVLGTPSF